MKPALVARLTLAALSLGLAMLLAHACQNRAKYEREALQKNSAAAAERQRVADSTLLKNEPLTQQKLKTYDTLRVVSDTALLRIRRGTVDSAQRAQLRARIRADLERHRLRPGAGR